METTARTLRYRKAVRAPERGATVVASKRLLKAACEKVAEARDLPWHEGASAHRIMLDEALLLIRAAVS